MPYLVFQLSEGLDLSPYGLAVIHDGRESNSHHSLIWMPGRGIVKDVDPSKREMYDFLRNFKFAGHWFEASAEEPREFEDSDDGVVDAMRVLFEYAPVIGGEYEEMVEQLVSGQEYHHFSWARVSPDDLDRFTIVLHWLQEEADREESVVVLSEKERLALEAVESASLMLCATNEDHMGNQVIPTEMDGVGFVQLQWKSSFGCSKEEMLYELEHGGRLMLSVSSVVLTFADMSLDVCGRISVALSDASVVDDMCTVLSRTVLKSNSSGFSAHAVQWVRQEELTICCSDELCFSVFSTVERRPNAGSQCAWSCFRALECVANNAWKKMGFFRVLYHFPDGSHEHRIRLREIINESGLTISSDAVSRALSRSAWVAVDSYELATVDCGPCFIVAVGCSTLHSRALEFCRRFLSTSHMHLSFLESISISPNS